MRSQADQDEINALNRRIQQLADELKESKELAANLQAEVESLTQTNENLVHANHSLKSDLQQVQDQLVAAQSQTYQSYSQEQAYEAPREVETHHHHEQQQHYEEGQYVTESHNAYHEEAHQQHKDDGFYEQNPSSTYGEHQQLQHQHDQYE